MKYVLKTNYLRNILIVFSIIAIGLPICVFLLVFPSFTKMLISNSEDEALRLASHLNSMILENQTELSRNSLTIKTLQEARRLKKHFGLMKLKIFSKSGEIIYSTEPKDIGEINKKRYFHDVIAKGEVYAKLVKKETPSLEDQMLPLNVVEAYAPMMKNGAFIGALEIYYDVTDRKATLDKLMSVSRITLSILALSLLGVIIIVLSKAGKTISRRKQAEEALQKSHEELESRVEERTAELVLANEKLQQEIEERKLAVEALRESEERYRIAIEHSNDAVGMVKDGKRIFVNQRFLDMFGYEDPKEIIGKPVHMNIHPDDLEKVTDIGSRIQQGDLSLNRYEAKFIKKNGEPIDIEASIARTTYRGEEVSLGYLRDITEQKRTADQIKASLREKEVLLSEIHHRVKNNMQVVSSLLKIQSDKIQDKEYADMFKESQHRIRSMALIHEKLYQSGDFANVDFQGYITSLVNGLFRSYGIDTNKIAIKIEFEDIALGIKTAIPCGLLINELVSNSLKYAFPEERKGKLSIAFRSINDDEFELIFSDDGVGIPEDLDIRNTDSLGLELVMILAEDQLEGKVELDRTNGTKYNILLKKQM